ncbi:hypothetical protein SCALM49S_08920 [Streptomyces californicus]
MAAAVGIAAADGLGAVSMGKVAQELGVSTMSLYRYVSAKDELYVLMQESALGAQGPLAALENGAGLAGRAHRVGVGAARALPRAPLGAPVPDGGPPATPNSVAWWEQGLYGAGGQRAR